MDTCKILDGSDAELTGSRLSVDTIGPLVDKAIAYLRNLLPREQSPKGVFESEDTKQVRQHLSVKPGDNTLGNLYRQQIFSAPRIIWICEAHAFQRLNSGSLAALRDFVRNNQGTFDAQLGKIRIILKSNEQATMFRKLLEGSARPFDLSHKLSWQSSTAVLEAFFAVVVGIGTQFLEVDGVVSNVRTPLKATEDLFARMTHSRLQLLNILNYPRPNDRYVYFSMGTGFVYQFYTQRSSSNAIESWRGLRKDLHESLGMVPAQPSQLLKIGHYLEYIAAQVVQRHGALNIKAIQMNLNFGSTSTRPTFDTTFRVYGGTGRGLTAAEFGMWVNLDWDEPDNDRIIQLLRMYTDATSLIIVIPDNQVLRPIGKLLQHWNNRRSCSGSICTNPRP